MSKISPMQAQALGLKPNVAIPTAVKATPAAKPVATKTVVTKPATSKPITTKIMPTKVILTKPVVVKAGEKVVIKSATKAAPKTAIKLANKPVNKTSTVRPAATAKSKVSTKKVNKKEPHKDAKKAKPEKIKMERDSFTMPKDEYAQIALLKARLTALGQPAKKSELLRAGIKLLATMSYNALKTTLGKIPVIKTGRPNK